MNIQTWRRVLIKWADMDEHKKKVQITQALIANALAKAKKPYCAVSGGKDSTAMAHLVLQHNSNVMFLHWDYGPYYIPRWLYKEILSNLRKIGANVRVETSKEYLRLKRLAINVLGREYLNKLIPCLKKEGYDLAFVGIRKEESLKRKRRIRSKQNITVIPECWPLQDWTYKDVWAYIFKNNLPYASIYDKYIEAQGLKQARFATFFDPEFDKLGAQQLDGILMWKDRHLKEI